MLQFFDEVYSKIQNIGGVDLIYFLNDSKIVREYKKTDANNHLEEILNIIKSEPELDNISKTFYSNSFHTFTLLNEAGLMIILKMGKSEKLYLVVIAGEKEPVDLIKLLKTCKEIRSNGPDVLGNTEHQV